MPDLPTSELTVLVEAGIRAREETSIPRDYIVDVIEKGKSGDIDLVRYPTGFPSLKCVADLARKEYERATSA